MNRREFVTLAGGTLAWPLAARAQQASEAPRIGIVFPGPQAAVPPRVEAVLNGVRAAGYRAPGQVELVLRATDGDPARITPLAAEIIASNVNVILALGAPALRAFRSATQTIPIVALDLESDPVDIGMVASIAHPGENITGLFVAFPEFTSKWLELLKETIPQLSRVAVLWDPSTGSMQKKAVERAAGLLNLTPEILEVQTPSDLDEAFSAASQRGVGALLMLSSPVFGANSPRAAELGRILIKDSVLRRNVIQAP